MAIKGRKSLLGEIYITDTVNPANDKSFWGKNAEEEATAYYNELQSRQKQEIFDPKSGTYKNIYPKDIEAFKTGKAVDITKIGSKLTSVQKEIKRLKHKENRKKITPQEQGVLDMLLQEEKNLFHSAGQDTTGMSGPQGDLAPSDPGIIQRVLNFFGSSSDDTELSESRWKAKKRSEIIGLLADGEIQIPEEYAGRNYDFRVDLVNAAWKAKMEKPAISKEVSEMTSQELKDFLDSYAK